MKVQKVKDQCRAIILVVGNNGLPDVGWELRGVGPAQGRGC